MPLWGAGIDHVAVAVGSIHDARIAAAAAGARGARVVDPLRPWPEAWPDCLSVPRSHRKWMATLDFGGRLLVLLAPASGDDLIARFLDVTGGPGVHHVAYSAPAFAATLAGCEALPDVVRVSEVAGDPLLTQVFLRVRGDTRTVELVRRAPGFTGTFRCSNTAALTRGEEAALGLPRVPVGQDRAPGAS